MDRSSCPEACNFIKKETLARVFSCEFSENFQNSVFALQLWMAASEYVKTELQKHNLIILGSRYQVLFNKINVFLASVPLKLMII